MVIISKLTFVYRLREDDNEKDLECLASTCWLSAPAHSSRCLWLAAALTSSLKVVAQKFHPQGNSS